MKWRELIVYVFIILVGAYGFYAWQSEINDREDSLCIESWSARETIRDSIRIAIIGHREALLETVVATSGRENGTFDEYKKQTNIAIEKAQTEIPNPECNLEEAQQRRNG